MPRLALAPGETITYRTQTGGRVAVRVANDNHPDPDRVEAYEAECEVCHEPHRANRTDASAVNEWARDHAARCTALPKDHVDIEAEARKHAATADRLLTDLKHRNAEDPAALLSRIEAHIKLAGVYVELARIQP
jgi:hypothetical protein